MAMQGHDEYSGRPIADNDLIRILRVEMYSVDGGFA